MARNLLKENITEAFVIALEEEKQLTRSEVNQAKLAKKGRRLAKKGGKVKGVTVSKDAMKHLTDRKPGQGSTPMKPADVVRQLKLAGKTHNKGQVAADAEHGRTTGTALVRKRSEIPDEDVVSTKKVMKQDAGKEVPVTNVQTNKPESEYGTTKGFSAAGPKDPRFMKGVPKQGRARKKFLSGKTLYTAAPGESAPRVGDWEKSGHVTVSPRREQIKNAVLNCLEEKDSTVFYGSQYDEKDPSEKQKKRYSDVEVHRDRKDGTTRRKKFSGKRAEGIRKALKARLPNLNPDSKKRKNPGSASHDDETMDMTDRNVATVHNRTEDNELKKRFPRKVPRREQIKNAVLEYLSPAAYSQRIKKSTDIASRQAPKRAAAITKQFGRDSGAGYYLGSHDGLDHKDYDEEQDRQVADLSTTRKNRVDRVKKGRGDSVLGKPTKLSKRGFDDQDMPNRPVKARKPSYDLGHRVRTGGGGTTGKYGTSKNLQKVHKGKIHLDKDYGATERRE